MDWYYYVVIGLIILILLAYYIICKKVFNLIFKRMKREIPLVELDLTKTRYKDYDQIVREHNAYFEKMEYQRLTIKSNDGLTLCANYYNQNSTKTAILVHGYKATVLNNFAMSGYFLYQQGYNILMIVQRSHGDSEGKYITFGVKEHEDLLLWSDYVNNNFKPEKILFYGPSMGSATIQLASDKLPQNTQGMILDCGFNRPYDEVSFVLAKKFKFKPRLILFGINILAKIHGFNLKKYSALDTLKSTKAKALFIHGKKDKMVPYSMGEQSFNACASQKKMITTDAEHCMSIYTDRIRIQNEILEFINTTK